MELERAKAIAEEVKSLLEPGCERIEIGGSIRRRKPDVGDIELLAIPKYVAGVDQLDKEIGALFIQRLLCYRRNKRGRITYGPKNKLLLHIPTGIGVDIFSTTEECWPVALVVRTGGKQTNIRISMAAQEMGYQFHAYGSGFSTLQGEIVCRSEREVFEAVGLPYREPWERD
ncbi:hypothetical protein ES703_80662 [subsurface metagenome]